MVTSEVAGGARDAARRLVPHSVRRRIFRARRSVRRRLRGEHHPWVRTEANPAVPNTFDDVVLYAVIGTWMEADVIADTVANSYAQGADRVFVVDNDSPDDTVARAVAAGAEHGLTYSTAGYDERYRLNLMNDFVRYRSESSGADHVWWLWLDADEFPRPEAGGTIGELVAGLDRRFRIVGGRFVDHYPSPGRPAFVPGEHPLDHQPLAEEMPQPICSHMHRKHPLMRWDREGPHIDADLGFHRARCAQRPLREPPTGLVIDHFPFRDEKATRRRLATLWGLDGAASARAERSHFTSLHMEARVESLDAVYSGAWTEVRNFAPGRPERGVSPVDWRELVPPVSHDIRRWPRHADDRA
jgi:hypothetical protein